MLTSLLGSSYDGCPAATRDRTITRGLGMITGCKRQKLGHPSEKLSGNVPRATLRAVLWSEIIFPVCTAVIFVIAYMFVKSFPDPVTGKYSPSPLIRIAVISLGPIVFNSCWRCSLCPYSLALRFPKFGSTIALIAHLLGVVGMVGGMVGFFEFLVSIGCHLCCLTHFFFHLEAWDTLPFSG